MADLPTMKFPLSPELDVAKFNATLMWMKNALGTFGGSLKPIDEKAFKDAIKSISNEAEKTIPEGFGKAGKKAQQEFEKPFQGKSDMFTKMFNLNQMTQVIQGVTSSVAQFQAPFVELDKQVRNIGTLGVKNFTEFSAAATELSMRVPDAAGTLASGVYDAVSAGMIKVKDGVADVAGGMQFMESASKLAVAGMIDTKTSVNTLAGVMNAYGASASEASKFSDTLFNAVVAGKTTVQEMSGALQNVVPVAASFGVTFDQVTAAIATMANQGVPTAAATTQIRQSLVEISKPGTELAAIMKKAGVSLESLKADGYQATMAKLGVAMEASGKKASQVFSSVEAAGAAMLLSGDKAARAAADWDTVKTGVGSTERAFVIAADGMEVKGKLMMNTIQAGFNAMMGPLGSVGSTALTTATSIAPLMTTLTALSTLGLGENIKKLGVSMITTLLPSLITTTTAAGATTFSMGALATATWAALAPLLPFIAIAGALGLAAYALSGGFNQTTDSMIKQADASANALDKQIKQKEQQVQQIDSNAKLAKSWEELGQKTNKSPEELERFNKLQLELIKAYPGTIDGTKSFGDNLIALKAKVSDTQGAVANYKKEIDALQGKKEVVLTTKVQLNAQKAVGDAQVEIQKIMQTGFVGRENMQNGEILKGMVYNLNTAKNSQELNTALGALYDKVWSSQNLTDEEKTKLTDSFEKVAQARSATMDRYDQVEKAKQKKRNEQVTSEIQAWAKANGIDIFGEKTPEQAARLSLQIGMIAGKQKMTTEEAKKLLAEMEKQTKETNKTAAAVSKIGTEYDATMKKYQEDRTAAATKEKDIREKMRSAEKAGDTDKVKQYKEELKQQEKVTDGINKEFQGQKKIGEAVDQRLDPKKGDSWFEKQKKALELEKKRGDIAIQQEENLLTYLAVSEKRDLSDTENLKIQQSKVESLQAQKDKMMEVFGVTEFTDGTIEFSPSIAKKIGKKDLANAEEMFANLDKELASAQKNLIKVKPKMDPNEFALEMNKLSLEETKAKIDLGFQMPGGMANLYLEQIDIINRQVAELQKKYGKAQTEAEKEELTISIRKKQAEIRTAEKEIADEKKAVGAKVLSDLEARNAKEVEEYQKTKDKEKSLYDTLIEATAKSTTGNIDAKYNDEKKALEKQKTDKIISELEYNYKLEKLDKDHQARLLIAQKSAEGMKMFNEQQSSAALLAEKQARLQKEIDLANANGDTAAVAKKMAEMDALKAQLKEKGDAMSMITTAMGDGIQNSINSLFAGDTNGMQENAKAMFAQIAGILKAQLSAFVLSMVLTPSVSAYFMALGPIAGPIAIAAFSGVVNAAVGAIANPVIDSLLSFSSGGRVDRPTVAVVGDASKGRPGADSEWIFRDDQIMALVNRAINDSVTRNISVQELYLNQMASYFGGAIDGLSREIQTIGKMINVDDVDALVKLNNLSDAITAISREQAKFYAGKIDENELNKAVKSPQTIIKSYNQSGFLSAQDILLSGSLPKNNPDLILNSPILKQMIETQNTKMNDEIIKGLDRINASIIDMDGRLHVMESDIGQAANRYNRNLIKRSIV